MEYLCPDCLNKIAFNHPVFCAKCSRPLSNPAKRLCRHCRHRELHFDRIWAAAIYDPTMRYLLHLFKYGQNTGLRLTFAEFLKQFVQRYHVPVQDCDLILPVPLHHTRFRERGFNQSELIARPLAAAWKIPFHPGILERYRFSIYQARVNSKQRWTNISGTFKIKHPDIIKDKNILIIDDLMTTGATLSEISRELKRAGAQKVYGLTVAIAITK